MKNKLSPKKSKWVRQFKPQIIKGAPIHNNAAVEDRYKKELQKLVTRMTKEVEREIKKLYQSPDGKVFFARDGSIASQARILMNSLTSKFNDMFGRSAQLMAEKMVGQADKASKASLANSLKDMAGMTINTNVTSADLKDTMKSRIAENVALIKSIPQQYLDRIGGTVYRSITSGQGLADLMPQIQKYGEMTETRAKTIALDQTRKTMQGVTADRLNKIGVKQFEWVHSGGSRFPRPDHQDMNGNIYSFDNLPIIDKNTGERGLPGQAPNCRCIMRPVLKFDEGEL